MKVSVIQRADGGISVATIIRDRRDDETQEDYFDACTRALVRGALSIAYYDQVVSSGGSVEAAKIHAFEMTKKRKPYADLVAEGLALSIHVIGILDESEIPVKDMFRDAWVASAGRVVHDMPKCKIIAHDKRRAMRAAELAPLDDIVAKQIPGNNLQQIEAQRQAIRDKYAAVQMAIDAAPDVAALKIALGVS